MYESRTGETEKLNHDEAKFCLIVYRKSSRTHGFYYYRYLGKPQQKLLFLSGPTTEALTPPPLPLELTGHSFFSKLFLELQQKFFILSGQALTSLRLG